MAAIPSPAELKRIVYWGQFTLTSYSCLYAVLAFDMVVSLGRERRLIWKAPNSPIKFLYLFNRWYGLCAATVVEAMFNVEVPRETCLKFASFEPGLLIPLYASYQGILAYRGYGLWRMNKVIGGLYAVLILACFVVQSCAMIGNSAVQYPDDPAPCIMTNPDTLRVVFYFTAPLIVDVIITATTFFKAVQLWKMTSSSVLRVFVKEGLVFFLCVMCINIVNGALWLQSYTPIQAIFSGAGLQLSTILACRLVLSLRQFDESPGSAAGSRAAARSFGQTPSKANEVHVLTDRRTFPAPDLELRSHSDEKDIPMDVIMNDSRV